MIRLEVIETAQPTAETLEELKRYASVADDGQDTVLMSALVTAFDRVQRAADTALLEGRYRISAEDHPGIIHVYMGGTVERVTDSLGLPVSFNQRGYKVYVGTDGNVEVEYSTRVVPADYARLMPVVLQYATAIYDGQETITLNSILRQCL